MFDATYKLTDLRMPLHLHQRPLRHRCSLPDKRLNDSWERASVIMTDKDMTERSILAEVFPGATLQLCLFHTLRSFKRLNDSWERTSVIMTGKAMTERSVLAEVFPGATLQLCLFHTLRSFKREFSMEKMGLRADMRDTVLEIMTAMVHVNSPTIFDENYAMLQDLQLQPVVEFFNKNWLGIKHEWVTCYKNDHFTLGELTNNWLESTNGKIKIVYS